ncbi:MAG: hypothetical protein WBG82_07550 [Parvibaculum sp.]|uniref:hypothetical protein n=1 Tax=Parvibaculum sp. TaxID=2024848 RepID=UPI003C7822A0
MVLFRLIGLLLITVALMALGSDALRSLEAGKVQVRSLSELWGLLNQSSFDTVTGWVTANVPVVSGPLTTGLAYPSWAVLGVIGIVIAGLVRLSRG